MSAPHLLADDVGGDRVVIAGPDARHAVRVLRIRPGERVTISDGAGAVVEALVVEAGATFVADVTSRRFEERRPPSITVVQGIPKGGKLDEIVAKLTELGVDEVIPLRAARTVARWDGSGKLARLRAIAREASKQSHRAWLPHIAEPVGIDGAPVGEVALVLHEEATERLSAALPAQAPGRVVLFVGPEGGFASEEVGMLRAKGARPVGLGPAILRTETAPVVAAALVLGRYGRIG